MAAQFYAELMGGNFTPPNAMINRTGPLPSLPASAPEAFWADGRINEDNGQLLGAHVAPYSWGANAKRITTQTQMNIPNKVQLMIPCLHVPSATGSGSMRVDPLLEHATNDGDLVFSLRMDDPMVQCGPNYVQMPYSNAYRCLKLVNLATANYLLWGLQVGCSLPDGKAVRWKAYFDHLCGRTGRPKYDGGRYTMEIVWNFLRTFVAPYGVQHGSDRQGGLHEGSDTRVVTTSNTYVSAFAVEGKLLKVNNLWRGSDVEENDDLVLELAYMPPQVACIPFSLCSSNRATRTENAPVPLGWWYLTPAVLKYKTYVTCPHIHVGRSQKSMGAFPQSKFGMGLPPWNARASALGSPLQMTFEPCFVSSDAMILRALTSWVMPGMSDADDLTQLGMMLSTEERKRRALLDDQGNDKEEAKKKAAAAASNFARPVASRKRVRVVTAAEPAYGVEAAGSADAQRDAARVAMVAGAGSAAAPDDRESTTLGPSKRRRARDAAAADPAARDAQAALSFAAFLAAPPQPQG